ncbi:MAG: T9SS type A sorting domain-containing protein [Bacteroidetes bacterium]|nr:T9SS type A sorting domain-containing protein [Bacteroidota bacterium]
MKNLKINFSFIFIFILISAKCSISFSQSGWILKSTGININSVFFISPSQGWMAGDSGLMYATYDGGMSWSGLESKTTERLNSVFFRNESTGWVAGDNGTIIKTTDGGDNWTVLFTGVTWKINSVNFPATDTGYAIGDKELRTTNGGMNWTDYGLPLSANSSFFISANTGFYVSSSNIFKTTNGGSGWFSTILSGSYNSVCFINSSTGWTSGSGPVRYTTNAGTSWTTQTTGAGFSTLYGIHFSDAVNGWCAGSIETIGGNSSIRRTTNSGTNWTGQYSGTANILRSVYAISGTNGIIVGDKGTVLSTTNSGTNWDNSLYAFTSPSDPLYTLNSVFFINNNTGWTGGFLGLINKTTDGGNKWTSALTSSYSTINSVHFIDKDTGWVCGQSGMIQYTTNGGANWTLQSLPVSNTINDINIGKFPLTGYFGLHKIGWCAADGGLLYKTTNGGFNWSGSSSGTTANLYSVVPFSEDVAVACGDSGKIIRTTNGGISWTAVVSGVVGGALRSLSFADENNGICAGDSATVLYTTNKGESWYPDITGPRSLTTKNLYDVSAKLDVMISYTAIGENGIILKSEDEGSTWTKLSGGVKTRLNGISSPSIGVSVIVGTRGTILRTEDGGALPVELSSFTYSVIENSVTLSWTTSSELNNSEFGIERKSYSEQWSSIGNVKGTGTSSVPNYYIFEDRELSPGMYSYRLKQRDFSGNYTYYYLSSNIQIGSPDKFILRQNYPNPFNPVTVISYTVPANNSMSKVKLMVYDNLGKEIETLVNENKPAGSYNVRLDGSSLSSGIYYYMLTAGEFKQTRRMMLLK